MHTEITSSLHTKVIFPRRVKRLAGMLADLLPSNVSVLDVGAGDGQISRRVMDLRPDVEISGVDVLVRPDTAIPVAQFDAKRLPADPKSFDFVMLIDVVHHASDPRHLLAEARRVAAQGLLIKDHVMQGALARPTLRLMDWVGNKRHGVHLPYNYWTSAQWDEVVAETGLTVATWHRRLGLYPAPFQPIFDRSLHFVASLRVP